MKHACPKCEITHSSRQKQDPRHALRVSHIHCSIGAEDPAVRRTTPMPQRFGRSTHSPVILPKARSIAALCVLSSCPFSPTCSPRLP